MLVKYAIVPPLVALPTDTFEVLAGVLQHKRGGAVIGVRILADMQSTPITAEHTGETISTLYLEVSEMAVTVKCDSVIYNPDGSMIIVWSDSSIEEHSNRASLLASVDGIDSALAKKLLKKGWFARSTDGSNPDWINGRTLQLDMGLELNQLAMGQD